jgi:hypothetical protein
MHLSLSENTRVSHRENVRAMGAGVVRRSTPASTRA